MNDNVLDRILVLVSDLSDFDSQELQPTQGPEDVSGWDSMRTLTLFLSLEDEFSVQLDFADYADGFTFALLAQRVAGELNDGAS